LVKILVYEIPKIPVLSGLLDIVGIINFLDRLFAEFRAVGTIFV
jgi:hypothetical protein